MESAEGEFQSADKTEIQAKVSFITVEKGSKDEGVEEEEEVDGVDFFEEFKAER